MVPVAVAATAVTAALRLEKIHTVGHSSSPTLCLPFSFLLLLHPHACFDSDVVLVFSFCVSLHAGIEIHPISVKITYH